MAPAHMELALRVGVSPFCIALYCLIFFYRFLRLFHLKLRLCHHRPRWSVIPYNVLIS